MSSVVNEWKHQTEDGSEGILNIKEKSVLRNVDGIEKQAISVPSGETRAKWRRNQLKERLKELESILAQSVRAFRNLAERAAEAHNEEMLGLNLAQAAEKEPKSISLAIGAPLTAREKTGSHNRHQLSTFLFAMITTKWKWLSRHAQF